MKTPSYLELEIALTHPTRIKSNDRLHRVLWHGKFLRGFTTKEDCMISIKFFKSFLNEVSYNKEQL